MRTILHEENATLRLEPGVPTPGGRASGGVLIWDDVPAGVLVSAWVSRPAELNEASDGGAGAAAPNPAPYRFDLAAAPGPFSYAGVIATRSRQRFLTTDAAAFGPLQALQLVPAFAAFGAPQSGSIFQSGRMSHSFQMPGFTGATPNLAPNDRRILRMRWTGTVVAGESQNARLTAPESGAAATPDGTRKKFAGRLFNRRIVPGSVAITATVGGGTLTLRDNGDGRLVGAIIGASPAFAVGARGDGVIDYIEGTFELAFGTAPDGASTIAAGYEHGCAYLPLDVRVSWESLLQ